MWLKIKLIRLKCHIDYVVLYICIYIYISIVFFNISMPLLESMLLSLTNTQLMLHLLRHGVTMCFTYADDDDDVQTGPV